MWPINIKTILNNNKENEISEYILLL
uniref:Uncharacterized protein n=1 Tax=Lepeophtheirus salmonis TaxID=72036 RepID=A0A0K2VJ34_LEPSM